MILLINKLMIFMMILMGVLGFSVDFNTSLGISHPMSIGLVIFFFYYCCHVMIKGSVTVTKSSKNILILIIAPMSLSLFMIIVILIESGNTNFTIEQLARVVHIIIMGAFILFGWDVVNRDPHKMIRYIVSSYLIVLFVIVFVGIWQWLHFYYGVPIINFYSRSHMHGLGANIVTIYSYRLTSFLGEPAFFVTYVLDFLMLSLVFFYHRILKIIIFLISLWLLFYSFSISGLAVVVFLGLQYILLNLKKKIIFIVLILTFFMMLASSSIVEIENSPFILRAKFIQSRLLGEPRIIESLASVNGALKSNIFNLLFGHGPASYATIHKYHIDNYYKRLPQTSNNLYADWLYENGFVGLCMLLIFFTSQIKKSVSRSLRYSSDFWLPYLTSSLVVGSLFRTDFAAPRFWLMILIITVLNKYGVNVFKKNMVLIYESRCCNSDI